MIVAAWFTLVFLIILVGFGLVGLTFRHWWKESRKAKKQTPVEKGPTTSLVH